LKWSDLPAENQLLGLLVVGTLATLLLGLIAFAPDALLPVLAVIGVGFAGAVIVMTRRSFSALHGDDAWRRGLPPPALPTPPPPTRPVPSRVFRPVTKDTCPVDGAALTPFTGDDQHCRVCLGVLLSPSSFELALERFGVEREIVKGLAEGHPTTMGCPACARLLAAPRLRDVVPLVCVGCGAAFFQSGDLEIFRGERPPRPRPPPRPARQVDDGSVSSSSSEISASWSGSWWAADGSDGDGGGDGGGGDGGGDGGGGD